MKDDTADPVDCVQELLDRIAADRAIRAQRLEDSTRDRLRSFDEYMKAWCAKQTADAAAWSDAHEANDAAWRTEIRARHTIDDERYEREGARLARNAAAQEKDDAVRVRIAAALEGILAHLRARP